MTRAELVTAWCQRLNKTLPPSLDATTEARAIGFFNQRQRRLLTLPGLRHLREATIRVTSTVGQAQLTLPHIAKLLRLFDPVNTRVLYEMSQQDLRLIDPEAISGTPESFVWIGRQAVARQPAAPVQLQVTSTHPADVALVTVSGLLDGNIPHTATAAFSGSAIGVGSLLWTRIDKLFLSVPCIGTFTLGEVGGGVLAEIPPGQTQSHYTGLTLWPTPSVAIEYHCDITRAMTDLLAATDEPLLPVDFHDVLLLGGIMDEYQHLNDERYLMARSEYERRVGEMQYWLSETAIGQPMSLTRGIQPASQLGSWYPAGS